MVRIVFILSALSPLLFSIYLILVNPLGVVDKLAEEERYDEALQLLQKSREIPFLKEDPRIYLASAEMKRRKNEIGQALGDLAKALEIVNKYPLLWKYKGFPAEHNLICDIRYEEALCSLQAKNYDSALSSLELALKEDLDPEILYQKALVHEYLGENQAAEADYRQAIEKSIEPAKKETALHNRAKYFIKHNLKELAIIDLKAALDQFECSEASCDLGKIYLEEDQLENAIDYLSRSLDKDENVIALRLRALAYTRQEKWDKALQDINRALTIQPENQAAQKDKQMIEKGLKLFREQN